ncbi:MAG: metallo-beta-lactamase family protein [Candidatus Rokubacteria bacterium CSP1-6]|nr:MAG: metallo-beta-lactamase family protein [Candidatus Rokubacteria bacterium CSP1-6]
MAQVFVLGAGTPTPTPHRFGSAFAVQVGGEYLMFDCGPAATHKLVKMGIFPTQVDYLFFTHHHFDHDVDYPCFLLCRWDQSVGKEQTLQVFGPTLTQTLTERIIGEQGVFAHDWKARVNHPLSQRVFVNRGGTLPRKPPHVLAKDVGPGPVHRGREWAVSAAPAEHVQPYLDSLAYRLDSTEGSIVFTGDTQPCRSVVDLARGADMMLCMCWDDQERMQANGEAPGQCGTTGAAQMAQEAGVKKLVLVHIGPHLSTHGPMEKGIGDVRRIYSGEIIFADELLALRV